MSDGATRQAALTVLNRLLSREASASDAEAWLHQVATALTALADSGKFAATGGLSHIGPQDRFDAAVIDALLCLENPDIWLRATPK